MPAEIDPALIGRAAGDSLDFASLIEEESLSRSRTLQANLERERGRGGSPGGRSFVPGSVPRIPRPSYSGTERERERKMSRRTTAELSWYEREERERLRWSEFDEGRREGRDMI
jgi:hypothetical protein